MIRVDGDMRKINVPALDHKTVHGLVYDIMNDKQRKDYEEFLETDFSFEVPGLARFRVNAFNHNRGAGAVFRTIPSKVLTLEDLGCPQTFKEIVDVAAVDPLRRVPVDAARLEAFIAVRPDFNEWSGDACGHMAAEDFGTILATRDDCGDVNIVNEKLWRERMGHYLGG